jgi:N-acetylglucosamine-6-phosphate deacetylase
VDKNKISLLPGGTIASSTFLMEDAFKNVVKKINLSAKEKRLFS